MMKVMSTKTAFGLEFLTESEVKEDHQEFSYCVQVDSEEVWYISWREFYLSVIAFSTTYS